MIVASFMTRDPVTIGPAEDLESAMRLMEEYDVRHLPVVEAGRLVGVLSDRDLLQLTGGMLGTRRRELQVREHMSARPVTAEPDDSAVAVLVEVVLRGIGCLPVVDDDGRLVGIVTETDLLREYVRLVREGRLGAAEPTVAELMSANPRTVQTADSMHDASWTMRTGDLRHVPVLDEERLAGILSDRDLRRAQAHGYGEETLAEEVMTPDPSTVAPEATLSDAAATMHRLRVGALPVMRHDRLVGILTIIDVLEDCMARLKLT